MVTHCMLLYEKYFIEEAGSMEESFKKAFGIPVKIRSCKAPKGLPFYMTNDRRFYHMKMADVSALLVELSSSEKFGVVAFEKQLKKYVEACGMPAAFIFPALKKPPALWR